MSLVEKAFLFFRVSLRGVGDFAGFVDFLGFYGSCEFFRFLRILVDFMILCNFAYFPYFVEFGAVGFSVVSGFARFVSFWIFRGVYGTCSCRGFSSFC